VRWIFVAGFGVMMLLEAGACTWKKPKPIPPAEEFYAEAMTLYQGKPNWLAKKFPGLQEKYKDTWASPIFQRRNYVRAIETFQEVIYNYPFSKYAILSELRIADCHFGMEEYEISVQSYEDFIRLHPVHEEVAYATYRLGLCHYHQRLKPGRDQSETEMAMVQFQILLSLYPESAHAEDARAKTSDCEESLARHNFLVARFYFKQNNYWAASSRFEKIWRNYPDSGYAEEALFRQAECYDRLSRGKEAILFYGQLVSRFPDSAFCETALSRKAELERKSRENKKIQD
jgi:outer membrane protein assembly factor BamD